MVNSKNKWVLVKNVKYYFCLLILFSGCASTPEQLLKKGIYYQDHGQRDDAIIVYENLLKHGTPITYQVLGDPRSEDPQKRYDRSLGGALSHAYAINMEYDSAIKIAEQTLKENPNDFLALLSLGIAQISKKDFANAKTNLLKAKSVRLELLQAYLWLAPIYLIEKDLEKAEICLEESMDVHPQNVVGRSFLVVIKCLKGNKQEAIQEFKQLVYAARMIDVLAMGKASGEFKHYYLDTLYSALNSVLLEDLERAYQELQENVEKTPNIGDYYFFLGVICLMKGDKSTAMEFLKKSVGNKGYFIFFSKEWLRALYAFDGDIKNFLILKDN